MSLLKGRLATLLRSRRVVVLAGMVVFLGLLRALLSLGGVRYQPADPLAAFEVSQVARVELSRRGQPPLVLTRGAEGWVVSSHGGLPAHGRVDGILARVRSWRRERVAGDDPDAQVEWQVDSDQTRELVLADARGEVLADLLIGGITGIEPEDVREQGYALDTETLGLFVRPADEARVFVVTEFVTGELEPDPARWYRQPALSFDPAAVRALAVTRGEQRAVVALQPAPRFVDDPRPVDTVVLQGLLRSLERIEVRGPAAEAPPAEAPRFELELLRGDPLSVRVWQVGERYLAALPERTLEIGRLVGSRLSALTPRALIRRRWCLQPASLVVGLEVRGPDGIDRLERMPGERWSYAREVAGVTHSVEVSKERMQPFVHALAGLEVAGWAPLPPETALPWSLVIRDLHGGATTLRFGRGSSPWPAQVEGVGGARLDGGLLGQLLERLAALHD